VILGRKWLRCHSGPPVASIVNRPPSVSFGDPLSACGTNRCPAPLCCTSPHPNRLVTSPTYSIPVLPWNIFSEWCVIRFSRSWNTKGGIAVWGATTHSSTRADRDNLESETPNQSILIIRAIPTNFAALPHYQEIGTEKKWWPLANLSKFSIWKECSTGYYLIFSSRSIFLNLWSAEINHRSVVFCLPKIAVTVIFGDERRSLQAFMQKIQERITCLRRFSGRLGPDTFPCLHGPVISPAKTPRR